MRVWLTWVVLVLVAVTAAGCGTGKNPMEGEGARATAQLFTSAVAENDLSRACHLLAPGTRDELEQETGKPCAAALADEALQPAGSLESSSTFGTMAQVRFAQDTVFVTRFEHGWRVLASGCSPVPDAPYDCVLKGQ
jgi:hypothetical protein